MLHLGNVALGGLLRPIDSTGATTTSTVPFDMQAGGVGPPSHVLGVILTGNVAANTSGNFGLEECETSGGSYTVVTGSSATTTFALPTAANGDNKMWAALIPVGGVRKRFIRLTVTGGAGATLVAGVIVGLGYNQMPSTDTERGNGNTSGSADGIAEWRYIANNA